MELPSRKQAVWETERKKTFLLFCSGMMAIAGSVLIGCGGMDSQSKAGGQRNPARAVHPDARKAWQEGKQHLFEKRHQKAIEAFSRATQLDPDFQPAYVWRGVARQEIGQRQKALEDFTKAIELDPTDNYALEQRAKLYREMGQLTKAQADEERAAQLREKNREQFRRNVEEAKKRRKRS